MNDGAGFAHFAAVDDDGNETNGKNQRYGQHEFGVQNQQINHHAYHRHRILYHDCQRRSDGVLQRAGVRVDARHQIAGTGLNKKTDGKILEMGEQSGAQIGDGADGDPLQAIHIQVA